MRFYIAGRYSRRAELVEKAKELEAVGHVVTATWLKGEHEALEGVANDSERAKWAEEDLKDIHNSTAVICFTEEKGSTASSGGRHWEAGYAYARGKTLVIIGPKENIFYCFWNHLWFNTWERFMSFVSAQLITPDMKTSEQTTAEPALENNR